MRYFVATEPMNPGAPWRIFSYRRFRAKGKYWEGKPPFYPVSLLLTAEGLRFLFIHPEEAYGQELLSLRFSALPQHQQRLTQRLVALYEAAWPWQAHELVEVIPASPFATLSGLWEPQVGRKSPGLQMQVLLDFLYEYQAGTFRAAPYWSQVQEGVENTFPLNGIYLKCQLRYAVQLKKASTIWESEHRRLRTLARDLITTEAEADAFAQLNGNWFGAPPPDEDKEDDSFESIFLLRHRQKLLRKVFFFASHGERVGYLQLEKEYQAIEQALSRSVFRDQFLLLPHFNTQIRQFLDRFVDYRPALMHFAGHGALNTEELNRLATKTSRDLTGKRSQGEVQLVFSPGENGAGDARLAGDQLANLLAPYAQDVDCVLLNACHSAAIAERLVQKLRYAIGIDWKIEDKHALAFARAFYHSLFSQAQNIPQTFAAAKSQLDIEWGEAPRSDTVAIRLFSHQTGGLLDEILPPQ